MMAVRFRVFSITFDSERTPPGQTTPPSVRTGDSSLNHNSPDGLASAVICIGHPFDRRDLVPRTTCDDEATTVTEKRKAKLLKLTEDVSSPDFKDGARGGPPLLFSVVFLNLVYRGLPYQPCIFRSHVLEH